MDKHKRVWRVRENRYLVLTYLSTSSDKQKSGVSCYIKTLARVDTDILYWQPDVPIKQAEKVYKDLFGILMDVLGTAYHYQRNSYLSWSDADIWEKIPISVYNP